MKLSKPFWIILGVGLFVVAAVILYMLYQDKVEKRQEAEDRVAAAEAVIPNLLSNKTDLEEELAQIEAGMTQLEAEMAQRQSTIGELANELSLLEDELSQLEDERAQAILRALALLDETAAKFISQVESIEYNETLFEFAQDSNLMVVGLSVADPISVVENDIKYYNTKFTIAVRGGVADILGFINIIVKDSNFKTAILEPIAITVPEPLTDEEKENLEEGIRSELTAEAIAELTTEDLVGFIIEAIAEVTGPESDWPDEIDTQTVEEMAGEIKSRLNEMVEAGFMDLLSGDLAELIEQHIAGSIISEIVSPLAEEIAALIAEGGEDAIVDLLGEDIAGLLGEQIMGALPGDIAGLLNKYIAELVEEKMVDSVAGIVEGSVEKRVAEEIEKQEIPSADITLNIYTYEGE